MALCQSCSKKIPDGVSHCPHCGAVQQPAQAEPKRTVFGYAPSEQDLQPFVAMTLCGQQLADA